VLECLAKGGRKAADGPAEALVSLIVTCPIVKQRVSSNIEPAKAYHNFPGPQGATRAQQTCEDSEGSVAESARQSLPGIGGPHQGLGRPCSPDWGHWAILARLAVIKPDLSDPDLTGPTESTKVTNVM
jgi:hypothetical protein